MWQRAAPTSGANQLRLDLTSLRAEYVFGTLFGGTAMIGSWCPRAMSALKYLVRTGVKRINDTQDRRQTHLTLPALHTRDLNDCQA